MESKYDIREFLAGIASGVMLLFMLLFILACTGVFDIVFLPGNNARTIMERDIRRKTDIIGMYIDKYYFDDIDSETMANAIYKGIFKGLGDDYAEYYTAEEYKDITEKSNGTYCGIGASVKEDFKTGDIVIVKPTEGGPAKKAGIKAGDIICAVDGEIVEGQDLSTVLSKVKGEEGTTVSLMVQRDGEEDYITIKVKRELIEEDTVFSKMLSGQTGYIKVTGFEEVTKKQFKNAVDTLEDAGMKSLIIDLRNNGGGLLSSAVTMLDRLLPKGLVVYTKDKSGIAEEFFAEDDICLKIPMAILVNGASASASEVFSGALQDNGVAKLVGTTTFGKGIVQTIFGLEDGTALKMTTSKYYTPKGRNIHKTGLKPDIEVKLDRDTLAKDDEGFVVDNQMQAALDYLAGN